LFPHCQKVGGSGPQNSHRIAATINSAKLQQSASTSVNIITTSRLTAFLVANSSPPWIFLADNELIKIVCERGWAASVIARGNDDPPRGGVRRRSRVGCDRSCVLPRYRVGYDQSCLIAGQFIPQSTVLGPYCSRTKRRPYIHLNTADRLAWHTSLAAACSRINKKLSCCCDSRSYCVQRTVHCMANNQTGFGYTLTNGWYARSDSTGRVYERIQTQSIQAGA